MGIGGRFGFAQVLKVDETGGQARFEGDATNGRKMIYRVPTEQGEVLAAVESFAVCRFHAVGVSPERARHPKILMVFRYITVCFPFFNLDEYKVEGGLEVLVVFTRICKGEEYG